MGMLFKMQQKARFSKTDVNNLNNLKKNYALPFIIYLLQSEMHCYRRVTCYMIQHFCIVLPKYKKYSHKFLDLYQPLFSFLFYTSLHSV